MQTTIIVCRSFPADTAIGITQVDATRDGFDPGATFAAIEIGEGTAFLVLVSGPSTVDALSDLVGACRDALRGRGVTLRVELAL